MRPGTSLAVAAALTAATSPIAAEERAEPIVVTATRTPLTADEALAAVTVVTREDIERRQPRDLPDLLDTLPGVDFSRSGGLGKAASLHLRGTNSDQTLVLVDGVRVNSATSGGAPLQDMPPEQIERVEVVRGPRASLYGADAIGGVVQIFTRRSGVHASVGAGSDDTYRVTAGVGRYGDRGGISINASRIDTGGFDSLDQSETAYSEPDDDGYRNDSLSLKGEYRVGDDLTLSGALMRAESDTEYDATFAGGSNEADNVQQSWQSQADWRPTGAWRSRLAVGQSFDDGIDELDGDRISRFTTRRNTVSWQNDIAVGDSQLITLGADYYREEVGGSTDFTEDSRDNLGVFGQQQWFVGDADVQVALRHDDNESYGEQTTGSVAAGYRLTPGVRAFASWGSAFRAPTFNDLYYPNDGFFVGNPDLDPERSRTGEVGLSGDGRIAWSLNAFRTEVDDLIVNATDPDTGILTPANVDEATIDGVEAGVRTSLAGFDTSLSYTWLDPRDDGTDNVLPGRARHLASATVERRVGAVLMGADVRYRGDRYNDVDNDIELDGYAVLDLRAAWYLDDHWTVRARIDNVLDEDYATAAFEDTFGTGAVAEYNSAGRGVFLSVAWQAEPRR